VEVDFKIHLSEEFYKSTSNLHGALVDALIELEALI